LLKSLNDKDPYPLTQILLFKREKKQCRFCGHNFTFECWICWLFSRQDCGKGKPWND